jgi:replication-associated recombination protein RarA
MEEVLFNPSTKRAVASFIEKPAHAVMITGPSGIGKGHVAKYVTSKLLKVEQGAVLKHAYVTVVAPEKGSISIDQVRELQKQLKLKVPGTDTIRRVIIIEQAQTMTVEAQNALLKSLEEPPSDTVIVMTATDSKLLLPTIESRVQQVSILPLNDEQMSKLGGDARALAISAGRPGLLHSMLSGEDHPLVIAIDDAKKFLTLAPYDRLVNVKELKERADVDVFLQALLIVSSTALHASANKKQNEPVKSWQMRTHRIYQAQNELRQNASVKLLLTDLSLAL